MSKSVGKTVERPAVSSTFWYSLGRDAGGVGV
jgi:hypothetical protein